MLTEEIKSVSTSFKIEGQYVDILGKSIFPASVTVEHGLIKEVLKLSSAPDCFIMPGFIDAHVHIESSMLVPSSFARLAVLHGTIGTVSDPHEIANVLGVQGVNFMIQNGKKVDFNFFFGAPSCVPATCFETAGAQINSEEVADLLDNDDIYYLSEMMNFPGVINNDEEVMNKIKASIHKGKPVDGHAPGLRGIDLKKYISAGISTDHECFTLEEAIEKLEHGMKIIIREGSAAKNFDALHTLIDSHPEMVMLCSDDKHPDSLVQGHINHLCARAIALGCNIFNVLRSACINPILHYKLPTGMLQAGDVANFIVVKDLIHFDVLQTFIKGRKVAENGHSLIGPISEVAINNFNAKHISPNQIKLEEKNYPRKDGYIQVIEAIDGQLITNSIWVSPKRLGTFLVANIDNDILKMVVYNRYCDATPNAAFVKNFGIKTGAIASTVAHDSHNIIAVGVDDEQIAKAINLLIDEKGGISCVNDDASLLLPLPVAGLMSLEEPKMVAESYTNISNMTKAMGSSLAAPFMTLSFMALLVIPHLKLSDKGLFNGDTFTLI